MKYYIVAIVLSNVSLICWLIGEEEPSKAHRIAALLLAASIVCIALGGAYA